MGVSALVMRVFLPFAVGYYLSYLFRTINALIAAPLTSELGLDAGDLGLLTSVYFLTFAVAQIPVGILLDRYGPRLIQSVLLVAAAVGAALFATSDNLLMLLLGRALLGLGVAASLTAGLKALVLWFPKDRLPFLNGLMVMLGALGAVTTTSPAQWLLAWVGCRTLFALLAVFTAGCSAMIYLDDLSLGAGECIGNAGPAWNSRGQLEEDLYRSAFLASGAAISDFRRHRLGAAGTLGSAVVH
ncbi:MFS transporter [Bradyrhizobium elkanii]|nr:MFS transporter [Bradyrhizobium elkanii]WLA47753.1 MFS transporter [Bradyrhizobium elkanii]WLB81944.1 MFS transporter [Bradyrhizobium elkanii]